MESTVTPETRPGYGQLLRTPHALSFVLPGFFARQPFAMLTMSIVLLLRDTSGSFATAGTVAAVAGVAMALFAPQSGRLADRFGQRAVLLPGVAVHTGSLIALASLALGDAPMWALVVTAVFVGASVPQIGPMVRARWAAALDQPDRRHLMPTAAAFESVTDEFTFVVGPLIATALCTFVHPGAGLGAEAVLTLVGGLLFAARRGTQPTVLGTSDRHARVAHVSALSVAGVRVLAVAFLGIGAVFGGMQVSLTVFAEEVGQPGVNGLLYGVFAGGNMLSGIVVGAVAWKSAPRHRLLVGYTALALTASSLWAVHSVALFAVVGLLVGMCIAPALVTGFTLIESLVPGSARTEAFTWLTGAVALGQAGAVTLSGSLADTHGASAGFLVPMAGTVLALIVLLSLRGSLRPASTGRTVARGVRHRPEVTVD
ncbi:Major Facilitator Superfamily protein [Streptomyces sp. YIM 130001]|uniref:MFS transporter n=1 Tax=Streptomyces sp. YIM 130001 TaxID=2259644 RepID=UPI000E64EC4D|nr:MFS transporter [Streptomyces sp. YIM 130001]RII14973.1 Major Facilitator Superfamily protein [Streptomyces sp. YIM 130001]